MAAASWSKRVASSQFSVPGLCGYKLATSACPALSKDVSTPEMRNLSFSPCLLLILLICSKWCSSLLGPSVRWLALTEQSRAVLILYGVCLGGMLLFWIMHASIVAIETL